MDRLAALIYVAGVGSRMKGVTADTNKCIVDLGGSTSIEHTILSFSAAGVQDFIIVVGYCGEKVKRHILQNAGPAVRCTFVQNDKYDYHGCEYSIACAAEKLMDYDTVFITEGDLLLHPQYIEKIVDRTAGSAVLLRGASQIVKSKSVVAVGDDLSYVNGFVYDPSHQDVMRLVPGGKKVIGESLQLWRFSGEDKKELAERLELYKRKADSSARACTGSGLVTINQVIEGKQVMVPVFVEGSDWLNINTADDVEIAKQLPWLRRR